MADGAVVLAEQIARLRSLGSLPKRSAPQVATALDPVMREQIASAVGPDGKAWPKTEDGHEPLQGAMRAVTIKAVGTVVLIRVEGHHARHHIGAVKGGKRRPIIPTGPIPTPMIKAITKVVEDDFRRTMGVAR